jgi:hypothetical protein
MNSWAPARSIFLTHRKLLNSRVKYWIRSLVNRDFPQHLDYLVKRQDAIFPHLHALINIMQRTTERICDRPTASITSGLNLESLGLVTAVQRIPSKVGRALRWMNFG